MVNPRKVYPVDPGLIPVFDLSGRANLSHALETAVRIELEHRGMDVRYVRTREGFEVDFMVRSPEGGETLIQVCLDLAEAGTKEREIRALFSAAKEHPRASLNVVTLMPEATRNVPENIHTHDAALWLLQPFAGHDMLICEKLQVPRA